MVFNRDVRHSRIKVMLKQRTCYSQDSRLFKTVARILLPIDPNNHTNINTMTCRWVYP